MNAIDIARKMAALGQEKDALRAYTLTVSQDPDPANQLEAAVYLLQNGEDYRFSYTCFRNLYNEGFCKEEVLAIMTEAFYLPNEKDLRGRYERNCKLLKKYPYLFRTDFPDFEDLPIRFYPYDDKGFIPFYVREERFGDYINFKHPVVSRNFFKDLENPILADDVYSQYELEYLNDTVRRSEDAARENHIYLHYSDWGVFCAHLQCLNFRPLLESKKIVLLMEEEIARYPIDFKAEYGMDYEAMTLQPFRLEEINRMIWCAQLSSHNGIDFFSEIMDGHPNLLYFPTVMMDYLEKSIQETQELLDKAKNLQDFIRVSKRISPKVAEELWRMKKRTEKDLLVALFFASDGTTVNLDPTARVAPALFLNPHFGNIEYTLTVRKRGETVLNAPEYERIQKSPVFRHFKYIKAFTPMRRFTASYGGEMKFIYQNFLKERKREAEGEVLKTRQVMLSDPVSRRVLNRSFMIDWQDRLFQDSVLIRFEDGKLNPKATFTALAAFLDLPYTQSMTYCSRGGEVDPESLPGNVRGFDATAIYRTYDEYANDAERYYLEYFLRDAYEAYGYSFQYYDGKPVTMEKVEELVRNFTTVNGYIEETMVPWLEPQIKAAAAESGMTEEKIRQDVLADYIRQLDTLRHLNAKYLLKDLRFVNKNGQQLRMMPLLKLDPALLQNPLYN